MCCGRELAFRSSFKPLLLLRHLLASGESDWLTWDVRRYQASLPDELDLRPGMKLRVLRLYDDAWGTAQVVSGQGEGSEIGKQGAFPIVSVLVLPTPWINVMSQPALFRQPLLEGLR